jgi:uncharacterized membrane protein SirB2
MMAKHIHVSCVIITFALFFIRGIWMIADSGLVQHTWARRLPPVVDTILLASAIFLCFTIRQYPFVHAWLTTKVVVLLLYIGLGMVALTYGRTKRIRVGSWVAAQLCFMYIVAVALTKSPQPLS